MSEWQPIETAPKDGCEIIAVFVKDYGPPFGKTVHGPWTVKWFGGKWVGSWDGSLVASYASDFRTEYEEPDMEPNHWMPLPSPPEVKP